MFRNSNEEKKLDWMYKGPASTVDREDYLLGRSVDKSLDQLNESERSRTEVKQPKNHVEHECIPPSIRDFKNLTTSEQVDLQQKLQEDPLLAIKKQEEETRRRLLQNPVQLKKLQEALKSKSDVNNRSKKSKSLDIDTRLAEKYSKLKGRIEDDTLKIQNRKKKDLDDILLKKFKKLKQKLGNNIDEILNVKLSSTDSEDENKRQRRKRKKLARSSTSSSVRSRNHKKSIYKKLSSDSSSSERETTSRRPTKAKEHSESRLDQKHVKRDYSKSGTDRRKDKHRNDLRKTDRLSPDTSEEETKHKKVNYGLVKADGSKILLGTSKYEEIPKKEEKRRATERKPEKHKTEPLSEQEKERLREEMMRNAKWRDAERECNVKRYREELKRDAEKQKGENFSSDFLKEQLRKSANTSTVESRIKSNIYNIQRSKGDMNMHFSRRY